MNLWDRDIDSIDARTDWFYLLGLAKMIEDGSVPDGDCVKTVIVTNKHVAQRLREIAASIAVTDQQYRRESNAT